MKRAAYFFELLLVVLLFGSCLTDTGSETDDRDVVIALTAFVEEGGTTASDPDYAIDDSLRVIMFDPNGGSIAYNEKPTPDDLIAVATGTYDIIIVANEASDPAFSARLDTYTPNSGKTMADLRYEYVSSSAIRNDVPIPMIGVYRGVQIADDFTVVCDGEKTSGRWAVKLTRLAMRIDLTIMADEAVATAFKGLRIGNVPDKVYLLADRETPFEVEFPSYRMYKANQGDTFLGYIKGHTPEWCDLQPTADQSFAQDTSGHLGGLYYWHKRLILPASVAIVSSEAELHTSTKGIRYEALIGKEVRRAYIAPYFDTRNQRIRLLLDIPDAVRSAMYAEACFSEFDSKLSYAEK